MSTKSYSSLAQMHYVMHSDLLGIDINLVPLDRVKLAIRVSWNSISLLERDHSLILLSFQKKNVDIEKDK